MKSPFVKKTVVFLLLMLFCPLVQKAQVSMDDVKKQANKLFEDDEFTAAYKLYSQLVANFPKDPAYNYRLGVCMIYSEPDKKKCIPYLKAAAANPKDTPKDVNFYLGKAYHINYLFDEAIKCYSEFKKTASQSLQKKLQVDREINACNNGKRLLSSLTDLVVQNKKSLNETDYFRSYDLKTIGGKLLVKPDEFRSVADKKKKEKSVVFLPKGSNVVYYSSYGENTETGKDIYTVAKLPSGEFGKPEKVKGINSEFDEDYPFLHPDGKTLYFASKGFNSMGGYDIFKSTFNEETNTWTKPENLEFPINSPDDDFLFVTDSLEKTAYFSTGRQSPPGKIDVLKINTERKPIDILVIKGTVVKESQDQSVKSSVTVKNLGNDQVVGTFEAQDNGDYSMELPNGARLLFTVETPGLKTQSDEIALPLATTSKPYKQTIAYENGILKIINQFDESGGEDSYLQYLKLIEKKAKLDVNEGENNLNVPTATVPEVAVADTAAGSDTKIKTRKENRPQVISEEPAVAATPTATTAEPAKSIDNKQLAQMASQDADEAQQEAAQMKRDAADAFETGTKQKIEAEKKLAEASDAIKSAESINNEEEKNNVLAKANEIKRSGESDLAVAEKILGYAKSLQNDAAGKEKEADLNRQYARELLNNTNAKNKKESLARIQELEKQLANNTGQKTESENIVNALKNDIEQKEAQLAKTEKINGDIKSNLGEIKAEISTKQAEQDKTRKKAIKEEIGAKLAELNSDKAEKEKQIGANEIEIVKLNEELNTLKNELELTQKIKTEEIAANVPETQAPVNTPIDGQKNTQPETKTPVPANNELKAGGLEEKYADRIRVSDPENKTELEKSIASLKEYNGAIDKAIAANKQQLSKTKNQQAKLAFNNELKQLEGRKKQNQQQIAAHSAKIQQLNQSIVKEQTASANRNTYSPIEASNGQEAVTKLKQLEDQLAFTDNENFDFNAYQNPRAQALKVEADARINDAVARQKKLKDEIAASKSGLENNASGNAAGNESVPLPVNAGNADQLARESDDLHNQAIQKLNDSKGKEGAEKDKLVAESRELEERSNEKQLELSEITKAQNNNAYASNKDNVANLLKAAKAPENEQIEAGRLNDEANIAFKQAQEIRAEATQETNTGARLGSMSNAEEKEAEALLKQQQAIDLLRKTNPDYVLKTSGTVSQPNTSGNAGDVAGKLATVNNGLGELAAIKIDSYQKLSDANTSELEELETAVKSKQGGLDSNPGLKSDYIAAGKKLEEAKQLRQNTDNATVPGEKLNNLIASVKKQNEALKQLGKLNTSLNQVAATANPPVNEPPPATDANTGAVTTSDQNAEDGKVKTNTTPEKPSTKEGMNTAAPANTLSTSELSGLAKNDTTTGHVLSYFNETNSTLRNPQADNMLKRSLNQLKNYEADVNSIEAKINNQSGNSESGSAVGQTAAETKAKSDALLVESDDLTGGAIQTRKMAEDKTGTEKDSLMTLARQQEEKALDKNVEAATLLFLSNEIDVATNNAAIDELLAKLRNDNPELSAELGAKRDEQSGLRSQIQRIRAEAEDQTDKSAKLGAINNAEERELELIQKQEQLIAELKKNYPDYTVKPLTSASLGTSPGESKESLLKKKKEIREKQFAELTNLTNAFSLEFESSKNKIPKNLDGDKQKARQSAQGLNAESKRLLIKSASEKNEAEKMKLLSQAAKLGSEAIGELNKILPPAGAVAAVSPAENNPVGDLEKIGKAIDQSNNKETVKPKTKPEVKKAVQPADGADALANAPARASGKTQVRIEGLEVRQGNAYTEARPIPLNAKIEDGLLFRVQIGAFKTQLPNNAFKGLNPLNAETTASGYFRYTAGNFNKIENANAVKNDLRGLGYSDAFVVAYYNGKRISLAEALDLMSKEGKTIDANAPQTAGITANTNVPKAAIVPAQANEQPVPSKELEKSNGLLYTIQIGVYNRRVTAFQLRNLRPVFTEQIPGGLFRYTAGIYNSTERLLTDKAKVIDLGIKDAFVSAYINGKKIPFAEAKNRQSSDASIKLEAEDPIIFPSGNVGTGAASPGEPAQPGQPAVQPFSNGVNTYPAATTDNGIKQTEEGVCYKVQIGAYSKQVPNDVAARFLAIKNWPIENKQVNGLYIYNIGNFSEARFAKTLKEEALKLGLEGVFVVVYKDGKKLSAAESADLIGR